MEPPGLVDCPTQLICTWIFICSMTKLKEHSREICYPWPKTSPLTTLDPLNEPLEPHRSLPWPPMTPKCSHSPTRSPQGPPEVPHHAKGSRQHILLVFQQAIKNYSAKMLFSIASTQLCEIFVIGWGGWWVQSFGSTRALAENKFYRSMTNPTLRRWQITWKTCWCISA